MDTNGFYFDNFGKIRVIEPEAEQQTSELKDGCKEFIGKTDEFRQQTNDFIQMANKLGDEVEKEKMKAIGNRNLLQSMSKTEEAKRQQLEALIAEKNCHLERLRLQYASLQKVEAEQNEFLEQFILKK